MVARTTSRALTLAAALLLSTPLSAVQIGYVNEAAPGYGVAADRFNIVWFTSGATIGHFGPGLGSLTVTGATDLKEIAIGPDGARWVTEPSTDHIYRCYAASCQTYTLSAGSQPTGITLGPDGLM